MSNNLFIYLLYPTLGRLFFTTRTLPKFASQSLWPFVCIITFSTTLARKRVGPLFKFCFKRFQAFVQFVAYYRTFYKFINILKDGNANFLKLHNKFNHFFPLRGFLDSISTIGENVGKVNLQLALSFHGGMHVD